TVPKHRKKRLYTAVMAARVQAAIQRGYRFLTIDASPMNKPIAASRGFQLLTYAHACTWGY
ncbi:MAG: N-acetyltransferase, partial [Chloroflexi bacterium]|nr:N-acetyltransferase [Chloroflexota bacterium]